MSLSSPAPAWARCAVRLGTPAARWHAQRHAPTVAPRARLVDSPRPSSSDRNSGTTKQKSGVHGECRGQAPIHQPDMGGMGRWSYVAPGC